MGTKPKDVAAHDAFQAIDKVIEAIDMTASDVNCLLGNQELQREYS